MPKIVAAGKNWEAVEVPGEFAADSNLAFLSSFEELTPQGTDQFFDRNLNPKKKIKKRKRDSDVKNAKKVTTTTGEETAEKPKKKETKKKKKQIKNQKVKENADSEPDQSVHVPTTSDAVTVMETNQNNVTEKPKKLKKKKKAVKKKSNKRDESDSGNSGEVKEDKGEPKKKKRKKAKQAENTVAEESTEDVIEEKMEQESVELESNNVEDSRKTDLSSWIPFCLPEEIMKALNDLGFEEPTEIQKLVLPSACRDQMDVLGAAETGSGKTLAYAIPLVTRLLDAQNSDEKWASEKGLRALVLAPTRELVVQIRKHLGALLKYTKFKATSVVGGLSQQKQERLLKYKPEIVVATPGRFWAMAKDALPDSYLGNWDKLLCLVVDETDRMVEKGHFEELEYILNFIKSRGNEKRQSLVFSATLTFVHPAPRRLDAQQSQQMTAKEKIDRLIEIVGMRKERKVFDITREFGTAEALVETRMNCANLLEKDTNVLYLLTRYPGRTLIFMNSIDASRRLHKILSKLDPEQVPMMLHARMIQKQRLNNLEKFAASPKSVMLATDVAARGLDIRGVEHVIHYQVPKTAELYVHRSGRTARAMQRGLTVLMVDPQDAQFYRRICRNLNREQELPVFPTDSIPLFKALKERVRAATEVESLEHRIKKIASRESWFEKTAREADLMLDGREKDKKLADEDLIDLRREKKAAEGKLRGAIATPLPRFDLVEVQKTRYVTPEVASNYGKTVTQNALSSYDESVNKEQLTKKNYRALVSTRHLRRFNDKRQRHKLKRK